MRYTIGTDDPYVAEILVVLVEWLEANEGKDPRFSVAEKIGCILSETKSLLLGLTPEEYNENAADWQFVSVRCRELHDHIEATPFW